MPMKDVLSRIGIGSATVDTVCPQTSTCSAGRSPSRCRIDSPEPRRTTPRRPRRQVRRGVQRRHLRPVELTEPFTIEAGETRRFETTIDIPRETPVTTRSTAAEVETASILGGGDSGEETYENRDKTASPQCSTRSIRSASRSTPRPVRQQLGAFSYLGELRAGVRVPAPARRVHRRGRRGRNRPGVRR